MDNGAYLFVAKRGDVLIAIIFAWPWFRQATRFFTLDGRRAVGVGAFIPIPMATAALYGNFHRLVCAVDPSVGLVTGLGRKSDKRTGHELRDPLRKRNGFVLDLVKYRGNDVHNERAGDRNSLPNLCNGVERGGRIGPEQHDHQQRSNGHTVAAERPKKPEICSG